MIDRLASVIYWATSAVALLCAFAGLVLAVNHSPDDLYWTGPVILSLVAAMFIWLAGRAVRYVLGAR